MMARKYNKSSKIQSKNYYKTKFKSDNVLFKLNNLKEDMLRKLALLYYKNYKYIALENLDKKSLSNKKKNKIKSIRSNLQKVPFYKIRQYFQERFESNTLFISRFYASTKTCSNCGHKQNIKLSERIYNCPNCNIILDRDFNSAINIVKEAGKNIISNPGGLHLEDIPEISIDYSFKKNIINRHIVQKYLNDSK
jgi:putative transposase